MSLRFWSIAVAASVWCFSFACSSEDERNPPAAAAASGKGGSSSGEPGEGGSSAVEGGSASVSGAAGAPDSPGAGGEGGIGHLGLGGTIASGGAPTYADPACDRSATWSGSAPLGGVNTPNADERLLAMTHDALTIVFSRDAALFVADRITANDAFGEPVAVSLPEPYTHERGIALQDDGLAMIVAEAEGATFADVTRNTRAGTFAGEPQIGRFKAVAEKVAFNGELSSPVLASDGSLYFTKLGPTSSYVFHAFIATAGTYFDAPDVPEDVVTLGGEDGDFKLTQSISADGRTLFIFDEALGHAVGLWNAVPDGPFTAPAQFPDLSSVFSGDGCMRLYGTTDVNGSLDIVVLSQN